MIASYVKTICTVLKTGYTGSMQAICWREEYGEMTSGGNELDIIRNEILSWPTKMEELSK